MALYVWIQGFGMKLSTAEHAQAFFFLLPKRLLLFNGEGKETSDSALKFVNFIGLCSAPLKWLNEIPYILQDLFTLLSLRKYLFILAGKKPCFFFCLNAQN